MVCVMFVWTPGGQSIDDELIPGPELSASLFDPAVSGLRLVGNPLHVAVFAAGLALVGLVTRRIPMAMAGVAVLLGSIGLARLLKTWIVRPDLDLIGSTVHNSFPSGHVAAAAGMVFAVALLLRPRYRVLVLLPGAVGVAVTIGATMVAGWHRLSDGLGAVLVAGTLYSLAVAIDRVISPNREGLQSVWPWRACC